MWNTRNVFYKYPSYLTIFCPVSSFTTDIERRRIIQPWWSWYRYFPVGCLSSLSSSGWFVVWNTPWWLGPAVGAKLSWTFRIDVRSSVVSCVPSDIIFTLSSADVPLLSTESSWTMPFPLCTFVSSELAWPLSVTSLEAFVFFICELSPDLSTLLTPVRWRFSRLSGSEGWFRLKSSLLLRLVLTTVPLHSVLCFINCEFDEIDFRESSSFIHPSKSWLGLTPVGLPFLLEKSNIIKVLRSCVNKSNAWFVFKAILQLFIYKALYDRSYLGSKTSMTTGEWSCLISFAWDPLTCSEGRRRREKFKMKIFFSSGIRTHASPRHD